MVSSDQLKGVDNLATNKNITMKQYNGADYDTLYPKTIASQVDGVYNKTEILTAATAALYGLGSDAVPDDVFALLKTLVGNAQTSADGKAKIETISYTGTGVGGSEANANILEVPEFAKIVVIVGLSNNTVIPYGTGILVKPNSVPSGFGPGGGFGGDRYSGIVSYSTKWVNTTLSWYAEGNNSNNGQLNIANFTYVAYCIG